MKMGIFGKPDPQKLMKKGDIEGLTKVLRDKEPIIRQSVIMILGTIALGGYKEYEGFWVREALKAAPEKAWAVSQAPWTSEKLWEREVSRVREKACWAISKAFLESEDVRVRMEATVFLKRLYERGGLPKELKKTIGKIMPKLNKMFGEKGKA